MKDAQPGEQLSFGQRVTLTDGIDHEAQRKDEGRAISDFVFVIFIAIIVVGGAIGAGFMFGLRNHLHRNPPDTDLMSRSIKVDTEKNGDTTRVTIIDKRIYIINTLTHEQKKDLKKALSH